MPIFPQDLMNDFGNFMQRAAAQQQQALMNQYALSQQQPKPKPKCRIPECRVAQAKHCETKTFSDALLNEGYCVTHSQNLRGWTDKIYGKLYYREPLTQEAK